MRVRSYSRLARWLVPLGVLAVSLAGMTSAAQGVGSSRANGARVTSAVTVLAPHHATAASDSVVGDPLTWKQMAHYLATLTDKVSVGVYDIENQQTYLYHSGLRQPTASMVKMGILAALLYDAQKAHTSLTSQQVALATSMIEASNNDAATALWNEIGQAPGMGSFNELLGFRHTIVNVAWGEVLTTPSDQLRLLKDLVFPNSLLTKPSRRFERNLMQHVEDYERFGIPTSVPSTLTTDDGTVPVTVGVKNGWYPEQTGWEINSAGYVLFGDDGYLAVVMTGHNPSEDYGMSVVNEVGHLLWKYESRQE